MAWLSAVGMVAALVASGSVARAQTQAPAAAPAASDAAGLTVTVRSVQAAGKRLVVTFDAVNGSQAPLVLADRGDPIVVTDDHGGIWRSADSIVRLDRLTTTSVRVDLAGPPVPGTDRMSLNFNDHASSSDHPVLSVGAITVVAGHATTFAAPRSRGVALAGTVGYNVDGVSVVVRRIDISPSLVEVSILVVNGNADEVKLVGDPQDIPFVEDDSGTKATFVPPSDDANLSIPGRQRLSGVLRFAGGIPSTATRLSLHFNDRYGSTDGPQNAIPRLDIGNLDLAGPTRAGP